MIGAYAMMAGGRDTTPDAVNWANISGAGGAQANADQTAAGFVGIATWRATISGTGGTGTGPTLTVVKGGVEGAVAAIANGNFVDVAVLSGNLVHFLAQIGSGGPKTCTVTVVNLATGATIDTFTVSISA